MQVVVDERTGIVTLAFAPTHRCDVTDIVAMQQLLKSTALYIQ